MGGPGSQKLRWRSRQLELEPISAFCPITNNMSESRACHEGGNIQAFVPKDACHRFAGTACHANAFRPCAVLQRTHACWLLRCKPTVEIARARGEAWTSVCAVGDTHPQLWWVSGAPNPDFLLCHMIIEAIRGEMLPRSLGGAGFWTLCGVTLRGFQGLKAAACLMYEMKGARSR